MHYSKITVFLYGVDGMKPGLSQKAVDLLRRDSEWRGRLEKAPRNYMRLFITAICETFYCNKNGKNSMISGLSHAFGKTLFTIFLQYFVCLLMIGFGNLKFLARFI